VSNAKANEKKIEATALDQPSLDAVSFFIPSDQPDKNEALSALQFSLFEITNARSLDNDARRRVGT
jgi:hypothetical protein